MTTTIYDQAKTFEEALELVQGSPSLRKIKSYLDNSNLSADMKALCYDVAKVTVSVAEKVIAVGRRAIALALALVEKLPHLTIGVIVAMVLTSLIGAVPLIGGVLALALSKLLLLLGITAGVIKDIRHNVAKSEMDRISAHFAALQSGMGVA